MHKKQSTLYSILEPSQTKTPSLRQPQVKTISIFIKNLDNHIDESYQKLKQKKQRNTPTPKQYYHQLHDNSSTFDNGSKFVLSTDKKQRSDIDSLAEMSKYSEQGQITLINNQEVTQYIHMVYDMYNIPDPLHQSTNSHYIDQPNEIQRVKNSRRTLTGTPILRKKSSASSFRDKMVKHRDIDLNPYQSNRKQSRQTQADISLLSTRSRGMPSKQKPKIIKLRQSNAIPKTNPINIKKLNQNSSSQSINTYTSQTFRYCFACQASVLQANLKFHEKQCIPLQKALTLSIQQLTQILDNRIQRLKRELKNDFVESKKDPFYAQYTNLKKSVGQWIQTLTPQQKQNSGKDTQNQIQKINQDWGKTFSTHFQSISKLHWFTRLRTNLRKIHSI